MSEVRTGYPYELGAEDPFAVPPPVIPECPLCSGKVSRDDPAAQALAWGVRVAEAKEGESNFWKVMLAGHLYRETTGHPGHRSPRSAQVQAVGPEDRGGGWGSQTSYLEAEDLDDVHFGPPEGGGGQPAEATTCCLVTFAYPVGTPSERGPSETAKGMVEVGWDFEVLAIFRNTGTDADGRKCACECCRFKQLADGENTQTLGSETQSDPASGEDCREIPTPEGKTKKICYGQGDEELRYSERTKDHSHEHESSTGLIESGPPGLQEKVDAAIAKAVGAGATVTRETACVYYMRDKPGVRADFSAQFTKNVCYTGQIWNLCPETLMQEEKFRLRMAGRVEADFVGGKLVPKIKWDPDGERKYIPNCDPR